MRTYSELELEHRSIRTFSTDGVRVDGAGGAPPGLAVTRVKAAEAIPFWLILPLIANRYLVDRPCLHQLDLIAHLGLFGRRE